MAETGLDDLFRTHYVRIARLIGRVIHDQSRAEDLAVDVFLRWKCTPSAQDVHAEGWLYRTAVRIALDELRWQHRKSRIERLLSFQRSTPVTPEALCADTMEHRNVRTVLATLPQQKASLLLLWGQDLSYREITSALRMNPKSIGTMLSRAQEAFRKEYVKRYGKQK